MRAAPLLRPRRRRRAPLRCCLVTGRPPIQRRSFLPLRPAKHGRESTGDAICQRISASLPSSLAVWKFFYISIFADRQALVQRALRRAGETPVTKAGEVRVCWGRDRPRRRRAVTHSVGASSGQGCRTGRKGQSDTAIWWGGCGEVQDAGTARSTQRTPRRRVGGGTRGCGGRGTAPGCVA